MFYLPLKPLTPGMCLLLFEVEQFCNKKIYLGQSSLRFYSSSLKLPPSGYSLPQYSSRVISSSRLLIVTCSFLLVPLLLTIPTLFWIKRGCRAFALNQYCCHCWFMIWIWISTISLLIAYFATLSAFSFPRDTWSLLGPTWMWYLSHDKLFLRWRTSVHKADPDDGCTCLNACECWYRDTTYECFSWAHLFSPL